MADRALTDLELERWLAGELPEARQGAATAADRARLDALRAEHAALLAGVDVAAEVAAIRRRAAPVAEPRRATWWRWVVPGGALVAAAAALVLVIGRGGPPIDDPGIKGGSVALIVHVASGAATRRVVTGDTVQPGDRVRFEVAVPARGYVAVVGFDGGGGATVYFPFAGRAPAPIDPRQPGGAVLPGAIELDATPGDERFVAVWGERAFALDDGLLAGLRAGRAPAGLATAEVAVHKRR